MLRAKDTFCRGVPVRLLLALGRIRIPNESIGEGGRDAKPPSETSRPLLPRITRARRRVLGVDKGGEAGLLIQSDWNLIQI
jgi:hypothetical protein